MLLQDPTPEINYITGNCWLLKIRDFLRQHQLSIEVKEAWNIPLPQENDLFIMDALRASGHFLTTNLHNLNAVRLFLQVTTLSDIVTADGCYITDNGFMGNPLVSRVSSLLWPRQPHVTTAQPLSWTSARCRVFTTTPTSLSSDHSKQHCQLKRPLRSWIHPFKLGCVIMITPRTSSFKIAPIHTCGRIKGNQEVPAGTLYSLQQSVSWPHVLRSISTQWHLLTVAGNKTDLYNMEVHSSLTPSKRNNPYISTIYQRPPPSPKATALKE